MQAARDGAEEVALPVLASTVTTCIVFFPVMFLFGVAKYLFSALALAVVLSMAASYLVAMSVIPIFCARFLTVEDARAAEAGGGQRHIWPPSIGCMSASPTGTRTSSDPFAQSQADSGDSASARCSSSA